MNSNIVGGIIPARYGSTRLPGKPLAMIAGKPMIQRVYEQCLKSHRLHCLYVATDDERVRQAVESFGGKVIMTRPDHPSGTDRVAEAARALPVHIVVNIQGDQPFINPLMIDEAVQPFLEKAEVDVVTLKFPITKEEDLTDPGVVKVVTDLQGHALYFSRSLIPYPREPIDHPVYEHVGLYVYPKDRLLRLTELPATLLEKVEALEQLRWLEHGIRIRVIESAVANRAVAGFSVDTPADVARAEAMLREEYNDREYLP